jgi:glycosyl transferase, family 25
LARSPERRAHITAELEKAHIDYEIVEGIDGRDIDLHDPQIIGPSVVDSSWFRPGVAGCALSHLRIYQKILADRLDLALVLEDDINVPTDLNDLADSLAEHLVGAEIALLNYDSEELCKMSREGSVDLASSRMLVLPIDVSQPKSSAAYIITREACKRMNDNVLPVRASPDNWGHFYDECVLDRVRCVVPLPVEKNAEFGSTIDYNSQDSLKARILRIVNQHNLQIFQYVIAFRRKRIGRKWTRVSIVDEPFTSKPSRLE